MEQKPTVGRIVHYMSYGTPGGEYPSTMRAAIIAEVHGADEATCVVFNPSGLHFNRAKFSVEPMPGHWSWPKRD